MNAIIFTQSGTLRMFYPLALRLQREKVLDTVGFYVTNSLYFENFSRDNPEFLQFPLLKEWEIIRHGKSKKVDVKTLRMYEKKYGDPFLASAIVADRRLYLGKFNNLYHDEKQTFTDGERMGILQESLERLESFFDQIKPNFILSFICVTIGEYLGYRIAAQRKIQFLNLRPTRIKNYIYAADTIYEPPASFSAGYERFRLSDCAVEVKKEAEDFMREFQVRETLYEGVSGSQGKPKRRKRWFRGLKNKFLGCARLLRKEFHYRLGRYQSDTHVKGFIFPALYKNIFVPLRICKIHSLLKDRYIQEENLADNQYAFYPLHKEPEVTLQVYNRYYLNQIEVIRNIAQSLPCGMRLFVKEHPVSVGYRDSGYYQKILSIPNVSLIHPQVKSRIVIENAQLVVVLGGTVGFEALLLKKPVIVLGNALYGLMRTSSLRKVESPTALSSAIVSLLETYQYDQQELLRYICYIMHHATRVDLYARLLHRSDAAAPDNNENFAEQIQRLAGYLTGKLLGNKVFIGG